MAKTASLWAQLVSFDKSKMDSWVAFRAALGMALSVAIGEMTHSSAIGLSIAIGALNVCYSDKSDSYIERAKRMFTASLISAVTVFVAGLAAHNLIVLFIVLIIGAFLAGMLVVLDSVTADLGVIGLATLLIFSSAPMDPQAALEMSLYALLGGILQTLISVGLWPIRRYKPERRALNYLYQDLAFLAVTVSYKKDTTPPGSLQSIETQNALIALAGDDRLEARRYRSLLSQGERLRITILSLLRLRNRLEREDHHIMVKELTSLLEVSSKVLRAVSQVITSGKTLGVGEKYLNEVQELTVKIRAHRKEDEGPFLTAVLDDLIYQIEALGGQLRAVAELVIKTTAVGSDRAKQAEASRPLKLRFWGSLAALRANLTLKSPGFRHAIRLAVCIGIGEVFSHLFPSHLHRAYWIPMTIAIVLKPDYAATFSRGMLRMLGTLMGVLLATVLFHIFPDAMWAHVVLVVLFTYLMRWIGSANYGIFAMCVGALVVVLISMEGVAPKDVVMARGMNTIIGGMIALIVYLLWPTSERLQMSEVLARMLESYLGYFKAVQDKVDGVSNYSDREVDLIRQSARVARANFQAATGRYLVERGANLEDKKVLSAITVASNRFAHAMMSVEAGSSQKLTTEQLAAFNQWALETETTLDLLIQALRGKEIAHKEFPDLRAAYVRFSESKDIQKHSLVYAESDRMTNSLLTLSEQVLKRLFMNRLEKSRAS
ncbi:MAG TPA: FUSC family protein [Bdellovibrio sp.]|uniref:FUSC family protein n=1 Tax=Bdellovibrio sp. TaxID=28201 RepID=UPI002EE0DEFF